MNASIAPYDPLKQRDALVTFSGTHNQHFLRGDAPYEEGVQRWLLLDAEQKIRGVAQLDYRFLQKPWVSVFVDPAWRGAGHGAPLLQRPLGLARELKCSAVYSFVGSATSFAEHQGAVLDSVYRAGQLNSRTELRPFPAGWRVVSHAQQRDEARLVSLWESLPKSWTTESGPCPALDAPPQDVLILFDPVDQPVALGWLAGNVEDDFPDWVEIEGLAVRQDVPVEVIAAFAQLLRMRTVGLPDVPLAPYPDTIIQALKLLEWRLTDEMECWRLDL